MQSRALLGVNLGPSGRGAAAPPAAPSADSLLRQPQEGRQRQLWGWQGRLWALSTHLRELLEPKPSEPWERHLLPALQSGCC